MLLIRSFLVTFSRILYNIINGKLGTKNQNETKQSELEPQHFDLFLRIKINSDCLENYLLIVVVVAGIAVAIAVAIQYSFSMEW